MRIGVFGNCQSDGVSLALESWIPGLKTMIQPLNELKLDDRDALDSARDRLLECDYILLQLVEIRRRQFQPFITSVMERAVGRTERWPVIAFNGFHPDCVYVQQGERVIEGPLGQYHSAIAAASWLEKLKEDRVERLFNTYTYTSLGYFDAYKASLEYLCSSAMGGYDLMNVLPTDTVFMHTINHPKIELCVEIARQAIDRLGLARQSTITLPRDPLAGGVVWPLYPEIGEMLGQTTPAALNFAELVKANYAALNDEAPNAASDSFSSGGPIGRSTLERARAFIRAEVI